MPPRKQIQDLVTGPGTNIVLALFWGIFAYNSLSGYAVRGGTAVLPFLVFETLVLVFFLCRTRAAATSFRVFDWVCALGGSYAGFLFLPGRATEYWQAGQILFWIGFSGKLFGLLSLNRSFALVPALRAIKTSGMYRVVRHPLYLSYFLVYSGYLLQSFSAWNCLVFAAFLVCMLSRIYTEERYLSQDPGYRAYAAKVRWRLIPWLY